jgi:hypothetical protein
MEGRGGRRLANDRNSPCVGWDGAANLAVATRKWEAIGMRWAFVFALAAGLAAPALAQAVDVEKAVQCQTLTQQFGDSLKTAKADDATKKSAADLAKQGDQACNSHNYDAGMDQIRQALQQVGLKPAR